MTSCYWTGNAVIGTSSGSRLKLSDCVQSAAKSNFWLTWYDENPGKACLLDGKPNYVGLIVTKHKDLVRLHMLSRSATGFLHNTVGDIVDAPQTTTADFNAIKSPVVSGPEGTGYVFNGGVVLETLGFNTDYYIDAAKVSQWCDWYHVDRIGIVVDLYRSVGGFQKNMGEGKMLIIGGTGDAISVGVVFIRARNGIVEIVPPKERFCSIM